MRATTLTPETIAVLRAWLKERHGQPEDPLFPTRQGRPLGRHAVTKLLAKHVTAAAADCPSLNSKRVTPHTLRHTNAMLLRAGGVDIATIALWLGHENIQTTRIYEHADPALKEKRSHEPPRSAPSQADTDPPTRCSHSSTASADYVERRHPIWHGKAWAADHAFHITVSVTYNPA